MIAKPHKIYVHVDNMIHKLKKWTQHTQAKMERMCWHGQY